MTNCNCGNPLRKGESECDSCILCKYGLKYFFPLHPNPVAQALRRAAIAWKNGGYHDVDEFYKE